MGNEVQLHSFLASAVDRNGQSTSYFSRLTCQDKALVPTIGDWMDLRADLDIKKKEKLFPLLGAKLHLQFIYLLIILNVNLTNTETQFAN